MSTTIIYFIVVCLIILVIFWLWLNSKQETFDSNPTLDKELKSNFESLGVKPINYINFNLTEKPIGNSCPNPMYWWWKYQYPKELKKQYASCNKDQCRTDQFNGATAQPYQDLKAMELNIEKWHGGQDTSHYANLTKFCKKNPHSLLCPNHWID